MFTSLTKEAMPIIRYRTRDLTRLLPGTARALRRMEKVTGRTDDMIILRGVNVFPTQIEEKLLTIPALSMHYQIVLTREARMDEMEIHVEARPDAGAARCPEGGGQSARTGDQGNHRHHGAGRSSVIPTRSNALLGKAQSHRRPSPANQN